MVPDTHLQKSHGPTIILFIMLVGYLELISSVEDFSVSGQDDTKSVLLTRRVCNVDELLG